VVSSHPQHPAPVNVNAHALSGFRVLPNGDSRQYTATTFPRSPYKGCEQIIRMATAFGYLAADGERYYAVLDVLDEDGDIVQDFRIRDATAFRWFYRKLHWRIEPAAAVAGGGAG
jgi:hypothetical protein